MVGQDIDGDGIAVVVRVLTGQPATQVRTFLPVKRVYLIAHVEIMAMPATSWPRWLHSSWPPPSAISAPVDHDAASRPSLIRHSGFITTETPAHVPRGPGWIM